MIPSDKNFDRIPEYGRLAEGAVGSPYSNETIDRLIGEHGLVALEPHIGVLEPESDG